MKTGTTIRNILMIFTAFLMAGVSMLAEKPGTPQGPDITHDGQHIIWGKNVTGGTALGYYLYVAEGKENDLTKFRKVSMFKLEVIKDTLKEFVPAGNHYVTSDGGNTWSGFTVFMYGAYQPSNNTDTMSGVIPFFPPFNRGGEFSIFMTAFNDDGESSPTAVRDLNLPRFEDYVNPPNPFHAESKWAISKDNKLSGQLVIKWAYSEGSQPKGYKLYMIGSDRLPQLLNPNNAELLKTFDMSLKLGESVTYSYQIDKDVTGLNFLTFFMTSFDDNNESKPTESVIFKLREPKGIKIISQPDISALVGTLYKYGVKVHAPAGEDIGYKLLQGPTGMTIDETTGEITWTPAEKGSVLAVVMAYLKSDTSVQDVQNIWIWVRGCHQSSVIVAEVVDENGNPIEFGMATAYENNPEKQRDSTRPGYEYNGRISQGMLYLPLDEGTYHLYFDGLGGYQSEWWENADSWDNSTSVTIKCGDTLYLKVVLKAVEKPHYYKVSGKVVSAVDNSPIAYAEVEFLGKSKNFGKPVPFRTFTKQDGNYEIELSNEYTYHARASFFANDSLNPNGKRYLPQFYNLTSDPTLAEIIDLSADKSGVDFALEERPVYDNGLSGKVVDKDNVPVANTFVIAYPVEIDQNHQHHLFHGHAIKTDVNGDYAFNDLLPAKYVLLAMPEMDTYAPGYYLLNDFAVLSWKDATVLEVTATSKTADLVIKLHDLRKLHGMGKLGGIISENGGVMKSGGDVPLSAKPVAGALAYLIDVNGNTLSGFDLSLTNGKFNIENLEVGQYKLVIDRVGYDSYTQLVNITTNTETIDLQVGMTSDGILSVNEPILNNIDLQIYPNPASEFVNINLTNATEKIELSISNLAGFELMSKAVSPNSYISIGEIPAGIYIIRINDGTGVKFAKLVVTR